MSPCKAHEKDMSEYTMTGRDCCRRSAVKTDSEDNFKGRPFLPSKGKVLFCSCSLVGLLRKDLIIFPRLVLNL